MADKSISSETIKRLLLDVKQIIKNPLTDNGIHYVHDEENILKGYAMIIGPEGTPYFGGYYFFDFTFPTDYPFSPPVVKYLTNDGSTRFNPNLYVNGKVCISILNTWAGDMWSSCQTITSILLTLCSVLNDSPLENEPGINKGSPHCAPYNKIIEYKNIDFAICNYLNEEKIPKKFKIFFPIITSKFIENYEKISNFIESRIEINVTITSLYDMKVYVDYKLLKERVNRFRKEIEEQK